MEKLDEKACLDLRAQLKTGSAIFLSGDQPAAVMTGILRELSALVTSRYHAAVLSMEKGCPIVAVSMDERLDNIMKDIASEKAYLLHVKDRYLGRDIYQALVSAFSRQEDIRENICLFTDENKKELTRMGIFLKDYVELKLHI